MCLYSWLSGARLRHENTVQLRQQNGMLDRRRPCHYVLLCYSSSSSDHSQCSVICSHGRCSQTHWIWIGLGFTWLFGYLAMVDILHFLWYPFILCNTCQGVFICVSFSLTPTVRGLWRDWYNAKHSNNTPDLSNPPTASPPENNNTRL